MRNPSGTRLTRLLAAPLLAVLVLASAGQAAAPHATARSVAQRAAATDLLSQVKKAGVITVGIAVDPPFTLQKPDGQWWSFNPTLVGLAAQALHVKVQWVAAGWPTIVAGLQAGKYDMIGASISATPERKKAIDFTIPYAYGGTSWLVRASSSYHTLQDLNNPKVTIALSTNTFQQEITTKMLPKATQRALPNASVASLISELASGRSDAISIPSFLEAAITSRFPYRAIPPGDKGVDPTGVAWGVRKGNNGTFLTFMNNFINQERRNGTIERLLKQYITPKNALG